MFVDTGGWYAVTAERDRHHASATRYFREMLDADATVLTSDYVLDETLTRLRYDAGHGTASAFWQRMEMAQQVGLLTILRVEAPVWTAAIEIFLRYHDQDFSFTDCTSFVLAQTHQVDEVFAFDHHFLMFGLAIRPNS